MSLCFVPYIHTYISPPYGLMNNEDFHGLEFVHVVLIICFDDPDDNGMEMPCSLWVNSLLGADHLLLLCSPAPGCLIFIGDELH